VDHFDVDVLTTCARTFLHDWSDNYHSAGDTFESGYRIRRFPLDQRGAATFDELNGSLLAVDPQRLRMDIARIPQTSQQTFLTENINSSPLVQYVAESRDQYLRFLFLPYLYGTTLRGIAAAGSRAVLQPCLHDESYAYLRPVERSIHRVPLLLFNSEGERDLAQRIYGPGIRHKSIVVGSGVEVLNAPVGTAPLPDGLTPGNFALYLGRRDATKGVDLLIRAFRRLDVPGFKLVLAGPGNGSYTEGDSIIDVGFVDPELRSSLLGSAAFLAQPSVNESFSRVMMEMWAYEKPVIAHARCMATAGAVERAGGGLLADTESEWTEAMVTLANLSTTEREKIGRAGRSYASEFADWTSVIDRYVTAFSPTTSRSTVAAGTTKAIHQVVETLEYGDAISNHAIAIRDHLREQGYLSDILVRHVGALVIDEARRFSDEIIASSNALIYHHSIGSELTASVVRSQLPTLMIYHNITPAVYFRRLRPELADRLDEGRADLAALNDSFAVLAADSQFNADELAELGYEDVHVLPIVADYRRFDVDPNPDIVRLMADDHKNMLFVGRYAPNKALQDLIRVLAALRRVGTHVRLVLAGRYDGNESYYAELRAEALNLGVLDAVVFTGLITDADLLAYYRGADIFLSLSEHEGFCVPLVEAMAFDIPIIAFASSAIGETLGSAGILLRDKSDPEAIAALIRIVLEDQKLQVKVLQSQRQRLRQFSADRTFEVLDDLVARLSTVRNAQ
jgi:glycosyltransferase involved in cell wall biosynthesis